MSTPPHPVRSILGETLHRGQRRRFGIQQADRLAHLWILGKTGTGKSTLLTNLMVQDLHAGRGLMLIDPHGDLAETLLDLVPAHRVAETISVNPADTAYPVAFNPLDATAQRSPTLATSAILTALQKAWPDFWGPRTEYILRNTLLTLLHTPGMTLLEVHRLLIDAAFRERIVQRLRDPHLLQFWRQEFAGYSRSFRTEVASPLSSTRPGSTWRFRSSATSSGNPPAPCHSSRPWPRIKSW